MAWVVVGFTHAMNAGRCCGLSAFVEEDREAKEFREGGGFGGQGVPADLVGEGGGLLAEGWGADGPGERGGVLGEGGHFQGV